MLYSHPEPFSTLLPLLRSSLPWSLPTFGPLAFVAHLDELIARQPPSSSSSPPPPRHTPPMGWASFPPSRSLFSPTPSLEPWVILLSLQAPSEPQLRVFCSAETGGNELSQVDMDRAGELVRECVMEAKKGWEKATGEELMRVASVSSLWVDHLGGWKEGQARVGVWLAPELVAREEDKVVGVGATEKLASSVAVAGVGEGKFVLRLGEEGDVERIIATADRPHPRSSIVPLLPFTSVASFIDNSLPSSSSTPAAWIVTKEDLSIGLLFTEPNFRRRGLGKLVVEHRIRASRAMGRPYCGVELDNEASSALWKSLGWEFGWIVGYQIPSPPSAMLLDEKEQPLLPRRPVDSVIVGPASSSIPSGSPPSYTDSLPLHPLHLSSPTLPSLLLNAPRSSHHSHCTSGPTPIYHTHLFDLARTIPEALLPKLSSADRPEAKAENGQRVNGFFWSERGEVKVVAGVLGAGNEGSEWIGTKRRPVRLVFGSGAERKGEGAVDVTILTRHPPTLPISVSLTSTTGDLHLLLPRDFRGHLTHLFDDRPTSSSSPTPSSPVILSAEIQAIYTPFSNSQGFIGSFEGGTEDASVDGLDEAFLSTGGTTITIGFVDEEEHPTVEVDTKEVVVVVSNEPATNISTPTPTHEPRPISSALDPLTSSLQPQPISTFWSHFWHPFLGPFLLGLILLLFVSTSVSTLYLLRHGAPDTLAHLRGLDWRELSQTLISTSIFLGGVMVVCGLGWSGWVVARSLGWGTGTGTPEEVGFVWRRLMGGWWEEERGWGGVKL